LALEPQRAEIVGFTSIFPRTFSVDGSRSSRRGLDAFVRRIIDGAGSGDVHHASLESMTKREVPLRFMCGPPVAANYQALLKIGSRSVGQMSYMHLPLTVTGLFRTLHFDRVAERLKTRSRSSGSASHLEDGPDPEAKDSARFIERTTPDFDRLWLIIRPAEVWWGFATGVRRVRYLDNPMLEQQVVVVEDRGNLLGWRSSAARERP